ncbi:hypothetical protein [Oceanicella sp. SM1341]|uniref:hypothetical protein n=1 Tax=Oceanicella sp. SM1341 TaxID=1548889 RepID=UPI0013003231|nr:hypothetical protein [Oceanicella sp. SM1341]
MHIDPRRGTGAKRLLGHATGAATPAGALVLGPGTPGREGLPRFAARTAPAPAIVPGGFEALAPRAIGVAHAHFIPGSTLFLLPGAAPAAPGPAPGPRAQGLPFAPFDLPQSGMNLVVPFFGVMAQAVIPPGTARVGPGCRQGACPVARLSGRYPGPGRLAGAPGPAGGGTDPRRLRLHGGLPAGGAGEADGRARRARLRRGAARTGRGGLPARHPLSPA